MATFHVLHGRLATTSRVRDERSCHRFRSWQTRQHTFFVITRPHALIPPFRHSVCVSVQSGLYSRMEGHKTLGDVEQGTGQHVPKATATKCDILRAKDRRSRGHHDSQTQGTKSAKTNTGLVIRL